MPVSATCAAKTSRTCAGVPATACVLEDQSHSTHQNAELTVPLLRERGVDEVLLVSDGYHLLRAQAQLIAAFEQDK